MILFLFYAVFVWYLCFRFRRQWMGVLCFLCSMGVLWLLADLYRLAIRWAKLNNFSLLDTRNDGQLFLMLLAVEAVIVAAVGIFFWCLPRHVAHLPCRGCGYELAGLDDDNPTCPECGLESAAARVKQRTCPACEVQSTWRTDRAHCESCEPPRTSARPGVNNPVEVTEKVEIDPATTDAPPLSLATAGSVHQSQAPAPEGPR